MLDPSFGGLGRPAWLVAPWPWCLGGVRLFGGGTGPGLCAPDRPWRPLLGASVARRWPWAERPSRRGGRQQGIRGAARAP
eukprot:scaffold46190_cov29-Tisochrysis_lutea.AAC.1